MAQRPAFGAGPLFILIALILYVYVCLFDATGLKRVPAIHKVWSRGTSGV